MNASERNRISLVMVLLLRQMTKDWGVSLDVYYDENDDDEQEMTISQHAEG